ncbi:ABC-type transporter, ATPase component [Renibacterium salmoninarum ATCC 33209]|uniref:ABC-type transporter, ATPase component n=1 Tax=Renibacterium salmoninarum (strain ATCC 33209 / DSM 20767 / JCM 11484 / NBRC 15589 / NCIMB 2235) TaxID=288705 RepID=A9WSQ1_RENSM|nr:ABC transporter ATP-binding protein [Renibacterium salmoninarum]ABY23839.1 ABC-type transporter, ATPase component [Renibacterium salmoninarum ATCC 33209]
MTIELTGVSVRVPAVESQRGPGGSANEIELLAEISLSLPQQRVSVIGANGSGKSTLLRLFNGLIHPTSGTVSVNGLDTVREGPAVRRRVGFMFTDPLSQLVMPTALEDIELSLRRKHPGKADRRAAAEAWLDRFGLSALGDQSVYSLSGGERQLVALASVLAVEPEILVLDEPTTLLDLANTYRLRQLLAALDLQIVMATHDLELAAEADRLLWVANGHIAYDGEPTAGIEKYRQRTAAEANAPRKGPVS